MPAPFRTRDRRGPYRSRDSSTAPSAPASFDPLAAFPWLHVAWSEDPSWTPPADGAAVSSWPNRGSVGGDFDQGTGANQPTYRATVAALSDQPGIEFTTSKYLLSTLASTTVAKTCSVVALVNLSLINADRYLFDLASAGAPTGCVWSQSGVWAACGLAASGGDTGTASSVGPHLAVAIYTATTFELEIDDASVGVSGATAAWTFNRAQLGGRDTAGDWLSGHYAFFGVVSGDIRDDPNYAEFVTWAEGRYGPF